MKYTATELTLITVLALAPACAGTWAEVKDTTAPITQHALPLTGAALQALQTSFYELCSREIVGRSPACVKARDSLNKAIDAYNAVNEPLLDGSENAEVRP